MKAWPVIYLLLAAFWLLAGTASGERIFFVLFLVQLLILLAALAINIWAALTFTFTQEISADQTVRGQPVQLKLNIYNEKPFPFPLMRIKIASPDIAENKDLSFNLAADARLAFDLELGCPHRGSFVVGMTVIDFVDLFGLFRMPFDMRLLPYYREKRLLVYPRVTPLPGLAVSLTGQINRPGRTGPVDDQNEPFAAVRDYRPGDAAKLIHWKASLRQQRLMTRQFDAASEPQILMLLDRQRPAGKAEQAMQTIDASCESAVSLARTLLTRGWPVRIVSVGDQPDVQTCSSLSEFHRLHRWLAQVEFNGTMPFHQLLSAELTRSHNNQIILAITHEASAELLNVLANAQRRRALLSVLMTGPVAAEPTFAEQVRKIGLPAWFFCAGDDLADVMRSKR